VAVDAAGNLLIADTGEARVRVVATTTGTFDGQAMATGDNYTIAGHQGPGANEPATAAFIEPESVAVDGAGNVLVGTSNSVDVVAASSVSFYGQAMTAGDIYTIAGGSAGVDLSTVSGVAVDGSGDVVFVGGGCVWVVAAAPGPLFGQEMSAGSVAPIGRSDSFPLDAGVAFDQTGNAVVADGSGDGVVEISRSSGAVVTVAVPEPPASPAMEDRPSQPSLRHRPAWPSTGPAT
jgi:hypothetical protein